MTDDELAQIDADQQWRRGSYDHGFEAQVNDQLVAEVRRLQAEVERLDPTLPAT